MLLRKYPEIFALSVIGLALFANLGVRKAIEGVDREAFRVRELVMHPDFRRPDPVREGILILKETLRCLKP